MKQLYMRLDVGFTTENLLSAASLVERWLNIKLTSKDDLELGGHFLSYSPQPLPNDGICGVQVRQNYVEGIGWRLPYRQDLPFCAEVEIYGNNVLKLGEYMSQARIVCGPLVSVASYVVTPSEFNEQDPSFPRAHYLEFGQNNAPLFDAPQLLCQLTFGLNTESLEQASTIGESLLHTSPIQGEAQDLGGAYIEFIGTTYTGLIRRNQISSIRWLYPQHQQYTLLLDVNWQTPNLLELGEFVHRIQTFQTQPLHLLAYRIVGDLVRDRIPRIVSFVDGS